MDGPSLVPRSGRPPHPFPSTSSQDIKARSLVTLLVTHPFLLLSPPSSRYETRNDECNEGSDEASNRHGSGVGGVVHRLRYAGSSRPSHIT